MKKKILAIVLCVAMLAIAIVGGTMAYFTDSDADRNVMVSGNVYIVQNETDRNGDAFENDQKLVPAVYNGTLAYDGTMNDTDGEGTINIWDKTVENEIDKVISVTNKGTEPAYIRTIILVENAEDYYGNELTDKLHLYYSGESRGVKLQWINEITVDGNPYEVLVFTYTDALGAGKTSVPSLMQIFVDPSADNDWSELLGDDNRLSILALSQAVQAQGFADVNAAFAASFGDVTAENVATWLAETGIKTDGVANVIGGN